MEVRFALSDGSCPFDLWLANNIKLRRSSLFNIISLLTIVRLRKEINDPKCPCTSNKSKVESAVDDGESASIFGKIFR